MIDQHKPLSAAEIEELWKLEAKATKGPWAFSPYGDENRCGVGVVMDENDEPIVGLDETEDGIVVEPVAPEVDGYANAALIAAMRNALPRFLAMLTPPTDAAVREAVRYFDDLRGEWSDEQLEDHLETLLSYVRAAQSPRLTGERLEAVRSVMPPEYGRYGGPLVHVVAFYEDGSSGLDSEFGAEKMRIHHGKFAAVRAAFPGVFGKEG